MNKTKDGKKILVVDDDESIRESIMDTLLHAGYTVKTAESGPVALEILGDYHPDLILLDIMMEPWDGWHTLEKIKKDPNMKDIPVSMLTVVPLTVESFEEKEYERNLLMFIENYLVKPVDPKALISAVRDIIEMDDYLAHVKKVLKENDEEGAALEFERAVRNLERLRKLKKTLLDCLVEEAKGMERVKRVVALQERNIELALRQIRVLENKYRKYGVRKWKEINHNE